MKKSDPSKYQKWSWMLFDWAAQPYFTLIATFVFPPYFVSQVVGDTIHGQVIWGTITAVACLVTGLVAPTIGNYIDEKQNLEAVFSTSCFVAVGGACAMWWIIPGTGASIWIAALSFVIATVGFETATSTNNAALLHIARDEEALSMAWKGWALGGASGLTVLIIFASMTKFDHLFAAPDTLGRLAGPFAALWLLFFCLPILFEKQQQTKPKVAEHIKKTPPLRMLMANLFLSDALLALFSFGGIYGAVVFQWEYQLLAIFGIVCTAAGFCGVAACIQLSRHIPTHQIIRGSAWGVIILGLFTLGLDRHSIWLWENKKLDMGMPLTQSELAFLLAGMLIGALSAILQASLRNMFIETVPPKSAGRWFGFFALSGKASAFVGPLAVSAIIYAFDSTRSGMIVILSMLMLGILLFRTKRATRDADYDRRLSTQPKQ